MQQRRLVDDVAELRLRVTRVRVQLDGRGAASDAGRQATRAGAAPPPTFTSSYLFKAVAHAAIGPPVRLPAAGESEDSYDDGRVSQA